MAQVLVRNLEDTTLVTLKQRAKSHRRSLQSEIRDILEDAAEHTCRVERFRREMQEFHAGFGDRLFSDSAELIRADRDR